MASLTVSNQYILCPELKFVLATLKKAGSSTFHRVLFPFKVSPKPMTPEVRALRDQGYTVAMFVRDPIARIVSAYEFFWYRMPQINNERYPGRDVQFWYDQHGLPGPMEFTFHQFLEGAVKRFFNDKHVTPQSTEHVDALGRVPNFFWPLERAQEGWDILRNDLPGLPAQLPRRNATKKRYGDDREYFDEHPDSWELFNSVYAADVRFYEEVAAAA